MMYSEAQIDMMMQNLEGLVKIDEARNLMILAHKGQKRKYNNKDYHTHPIAVAQILNQLNVSDEIVIAALLHDTLEDTELTEKEIEDQFGSYVLGLVKEVTNQCLEGNRATRTNNEHERLSKCSQEAKMIKLADRYHNLSEMDGADKGWIKKYTSESEHLLEKIGDACPILSARLAEVITKRKQECLC